MPLPPLKTARSGKPLSVRSLTITAIGPSPPDFRRGPGMPTQSPFGVVGAEDHGDVVAALVGDQHVGNAVAVQVGHGDAGRGGADEIGLRRRGEARHAVRD